MKTRTTRMSLIVVIGTAAVIRLLYQVHNLDSPDVRIPLRDAAYHQYWAASLAQGTWDELHGRADPEIRTHPYFRPPGYAFFLASIYRNFGVGPRAPRLIQSLLGLLNVLLAFVLARRWFGPAVALLFAGFMAVDWHLVYFEGELVDPTLVITLCLLLLHTLGLHARAPSTLRVFLAGLLLGLLAIVRPNLLAFGLPAVLWIAGLDTMHHRWKDAVRAAVTFVVGVILPIAPVTIRNTLAEHDPVLICSNGGVNLFLGNNPEANGIDPAGPGLRSWTSFDYPDVVRTLECQRDRSLTCRQSSAHFARRALHWIRTHPVEALRLTAKKAALFWGPREICQEEEIALEKQHSPVLRFLPFPMPVTLGLALAGALIFCRSYSQNRTPGLNAFALLLGLFVLTDFLTILPFFADTRFRLPVMPILWLTAAAGIVWAGRQARTRHLRRLAFWGIAAVLGITATAIEIVPHPNRPERWHVDRGACFRRTGQMAQAEAEYQKALALKPDEYGAHFGLGLLYEETGQLQDSLYHFNRAARVNDTVDSVHLARALVLRRLKKPQEAIQALRDVVRVNPAHDTAHTGLAVLLAQQGELDEAIAHFEVALRINPDNTRARLGLAHARTLQAREPTAPTPSH